MYIENNSHIELLNIDRNRVLFEKNPPPCAPDPREMDVFSTLIKYKKSVYVNGRTNHVSGMRPVRFGSGNSLQSTRCIPQR